jgi:hypothetical protein
MAGGFFTAMRNIEKQVVQDEAQIRLARTVVGQRRRWVARKSIVQQRLDELVQVVNLLQLAPRVLIQFAFPRQDVQLFEQFNRLARAKFFNHLRDLRWL